MLTKLTKKQELLKQQIREEYLAEFRRMVPVSDADIRQFVYLLYEYAKLPKPVVIILDSPMACQLVANVLSRPQDDVAAGVAAGVRAGVAAGVWAGVRAGVAAGVRAGVAAGVRAGVDAGVRAGVDAGVAAGVDAGVAAGVAAGVRAGVWAGVRAGVAAGVRDGVADGKLTFFPDAYRGTVYDLGWVAFYDYFTRIGVINKNEFNEYCKMLRQTHVFYMIQQRSACFVSRNPIQCPFNQFGRVTGVIRFKDGYEIAEIGGIYVKREMYDKFFAGPRRSLAEILAVGNQTLEAAIIAAYGLDTIISELHPKVLDTWERQNKWKHTISRDELWEFKLLGATRRGLYYEDFSTDKHGVLLVSVSCNTAKEAAAWTFTIPVEDYVLQEES
jgi:hypothetical protein